MYKFYLIKTNNNRLLRETEQRINDSRGHIDYVIPLGDGVLIVVAE